MRAVEDEPRATMIESGRGPPLSTGYVAGTAVSSRELISVRVVASMTRRARRLQPRVIESYLEVNLAGWNVAGTAGKECVSAFQREFGCRVVEVHVDTPALRVVARGTRLPLHPSVKLCSVRVVLRMAGEAGKVLKSKTQMCAVRSVTRSTGDTKVGPGQSEARFLVVPTDVVRSGYPDVDVVTSVARRRFCPEYSVVVVDMARRARRRLDGRVSLRGRIAQEGHTNPAVVAGRFSMA